LRFGAVLLALYFSAVSGSYALGMSVFSVASLVQLVADVPTGALADRFGRKPAIVAGAAVSIGFTVCYAAGRGYALLVAGAALEGLARALFSGADAALLYDTLAEERQEARYAGALGRISAAEQGAFVVAAIAGGVVAAVWSPRAAFWLTLVPQGVALCLALLLHEPSRGRSGVRDRGTIAGALRPFLRNRRLRLLVGAAAWREAWGESSFQFRVTFFQQLWPLWALGLAQTLTFAASTLSFYASGRIIRRFGAVRVLVADSICGRLLGLPALLLASGVSPLLLSLQSLTYGPSEVASGTLQQGEFDDRTRATMGSIASEAVNLAFAAGAVALGLLADRAGIVPALLAAQLLLLGTVPLYLRLERPDGEP
jgi:MFS family permease